jgi:hypothetical protein
MKCNINVIIFETTKFYDIISLSLENTNMLAVLTCVGTDCVN